MKSTGRMVRLLAAVLAAGVLAGCGDHFGEGYLSIFSHSVDSGLPEQEKQGPVNLKVPYDINDSLAPYKATSGLNLSIMPLLYDPLVKLSPQYHGDPYLASSVEMDGLECTVTLRGDAVFSNGAPLRAADVVYSFEQAKKLPARYPQLVDLVETCEPVGENQVRFTILREDQNFPNLLTFPVVPADSEEQTGVPGTGRYRLSPQGRGYILTRNDSHFDGGSTVKTIQLVEVPDDDALLSSIKTGMVDYLFSDLSSSDFYSISSAIEPVDINNLVYLGFNQTEDLLSNAEFRILLESYLNKGELVSRVYSNRAEAADTPFLPSYYDLPQGALPKALSLDERNMALDTMGLKERDQEGYRLYNGERVSFTLLINGDNDSRKTMAKELANQFQSIGVELKVTEDSFEDYKRALASGGYDLFLGEMKIGDNMDIVSLLSGASVGIKDSVFDLSLLNSYREYQAGRLSCQDFLQAFDRIQPVIPLVYRQGMVAYSHSLPSNIQATYQDIFYNLSDW